MRLWLLFIAILSQVLISQALLGKNINVAADRVVDADIITLDGEIDGIRIDEAERKARSLVVVLDTSYSMRHVRSEQIKPAVIAALKKIVGLYEQLSSVAIYSTENHLIFLYVNGSVWDDQRKEYIANELEKVAFYYIESASNPFDGVQKSLARVEHGDGDPVSVFVIGDDVYRPVLSEIEQSVDAVRSLAQDKAFTLNAIFVETEKRSLAESTPRFLLEMAPLVGAGGGRIYQINQRTVEKMDKALKNFAMVRRPPNVIYRTTYETIHTR